MMHYTRVPDTCLVENALGKQLRMRLYRGYIEVTTLRKHIVVELIYEGEPNFVALKEMVEKSQTA